MPTVALLTDMNQVLGTTAGNAVEVLEAVEFLRGENIDPRLYEVTVSLCAELLLIGKLASDEKEARDKIADALDSGRAAEHFQRMVSTLSGPSDFVEKPMSYLASANVKHEVYAPKSGYLSFVDARGVGIGIVELGGGRRKPSDNIDHSVGLSAVAQLGDKLDQGGKPLAIIHADSKDDAIRMEKKLLGLIEMSDKPVDLADAVSERVE